MEDEGRVGPVPEGLTPEEEEDYRAWSSKWSQRQYEKYKEERLEEVGRSRGLSKALFAAAALLFAFAYYIGDRAARGSSPSSFEAGSIAVVSLGVFCFLTKRGGEEADMHLYAIALAVFALFMLVVPGLASA